MRIAGLQKTTLLDYPGKVACTVFLAGCNLRCPFCHNASLVLPARDTSQLTEASLFAYLEKRQGVLDGVCISGGEPTLAPDLPELLRKIKALDYSVKLDTNGSNPKMLAALLEEGLIDFVAMDIKNSPARYRETCGGVDILDAVRESVALLMQSGIAYEFRTTAVHPLHSPAELREIGAWLHGAQRFFVQQFIDSGDLVGSGITPLSAKEMADLLEAIRPDIPTAAIRGV